MSNKIVIATTMRFHLVDLARELDKLGENVFLFSIVPRKRLMEFGLRKDIIHSMFFPLFLFIALDRIFSHSFFVHRLYFQVVDLYVSFFVRKADLFIGLGTAYNRCFKVAKKRGIQTIMEWGSKHIDVQQEILKKINAPINKEYYNKRSKEIYEIADYIAIPSKHVSESFIKKNISKNKLLINAYGVDLNNFPPTRIEQDDVFDLIFVGRWSLRKGCDYLEWFCRQRPRYRVLHVGGIEDGFQFPKLPNLIHHPAVREQELTYQYKRARVFILLSREEGLSLVQCQALASGLPIICTKDTGGEDLKQYIDAPEYIHVLENLELDTIEKAIQESLLQSEKLPEFRMVSTSYENLSWHAYALRYKNNIDKIMKGNEIKGFNN